MTRKDWMLPSEEAIGRSLTPQPAGRTAEGGWKTRRAMTLLICAAAALTLLLGAVLSSMGDVKEAAAPETPGSTTDTPPGNPLGVYGTTYAADGTTPLGSCAVNITNENTGYSWYVTSSGTGFYYMGIYAVAGDEIHVSAVNGDLYGETTAYVPSGVVSMAVNVVLNQVIPEFPMALVPVVGMLALVAVAGIRRRRSVEP